MTVFEDHNIMIGSEGFYAGACKSTQAFQDENWDSLVIEKGLPRTYPCDTLPRQMTFSITDNLDREKFREKMQKLRGVQLFTSDIIGSFKALIKFTSWNYPNSQPTVTVLEVQITEVSAK